MINSGIYKITNLVNQKFYIGSAINLAKRKSDHFSSLKRGDHHNKILQRSYNKYGESNFYFEVIEYVEFKENLIPREQHYIDIIKPEFNIYKVAGSCLGVKMSKETRLKMSRPKSEEHKIKIGLIHKGKPKLTLRKAVTQLNLITKEIIKEWPSLTEAQNTLKIPTSHISKVCNGKSKSAGGFNWEYRGI